MAEQEFKYLAIKNWSKYQSDDKGKVRSGQSSWVKDWTDKESDAGYMALTVFQRYILDGCRRLRGKFGRNVRNDPAYISMALQVGRKERHCVPRCVRVLSERGFLILTNQEVDFLDKEEEIDKERTKPSQRKAPSKTDPRFKEFLEVLYRYHGKFVGEAKLKFSVWFGRRGGKQLKNLLKAEPDLDFDTFQKAIFVRARSPNVNHTQLVYEWIFHVLSGPKGFQNGQQKISNAEQKQQRNDDKYARIEQRIGGIPAGLGIVIPGGIGGGGNRDVDSRSKLLPIKGNTGSS